MRATAPTRDCAPHECVASRGTGPLPPKPWSGRGRPTSRRRRDAEHQPVQAKALAIGLPAEAWEAITWREGSADWLTGSVRNFVRG